MASRAMAALKTLGSLALIGLVFIWGTGLGAAQDAAPAEQAPPENQILSGIQLGTMPDYSRLVLRFAQPVAEYTVLRVDVDQIMLNFGKAQADRYGRLGLQDHLIEGLAVQREKEGLVLRVRTRTPRFDFRHFAARDGRSVVVDFRAVSAELTGVTHTPEPQTPVLELKPPTVKETAEKVRKNLSAKPMPGSDEAMVAEAADLIEAGRIEAGIAVLQEFKAKYPGSLFRDPALFLLGEAYYFLDPDNLGDRFLQATETLKTALGLFPNSPFAARARLLLAMAYMKMEFVTEAVEQFKLVTQKNPNGIEATIAQVYLGRLFLTLGKVQLAKVAFDAALAANPAGSFFLDAYYDLGETFFKEGLFSQSTEVFKTILEKDEWYYVDHPEILYYMGEGYFNLERMDMARAFLYHSINLLPEQKDADIVLARIGDTYMESDQDSDAIKIFDLVRSLYPKTSGALISKMRLADFGALRRLFSEKTLFQELQDGGHAATIKIYKEILETQEDSPLVQLALFKLGLAYLKHGDYPQAADVFKRFLTQYPKSTLKGDATRLAGESIFNHLKSLYHLRQFNDMIAYYTENKDLIDRDSWPELRHYLGMAFAELNQPEKSIELLEANKDMEINEAQRLFTLSKDYMDLGRYDDAFKKMEEYRKQFPEAPGITGTLVDQALAEMAQGRDNEALTHLESALAKDPKLEEDVRIQDALGQLYSKKEDLEKASAAIQKAIDLKKAASSTENLFSDYLRLGEILTKLKKTEEAKAALGEALKGMDPTTPPETTYILASYFQQLGQDKEYREVLERLAKSGDPFWKNAAEEELKSLTPDDQVTKLLDEQPPEP